MKVLKVLVRPLRLDATCSPPAQVCVTLGHMNWVRDWHDEPAPGTGTAVMWTPAGPVIVGASPLRVACPVASCRAAIGEHCTRLVPRKGRVRCATHKPRIELAAQSVEGDTGPLATAS